MKIATIFLLSFVFAIFGLNTIYAQLSKVDTSDFYALEFDGINDYVILTDFSVPDSFTIEMWIAPYSTVNNQLFIGKHTNSGGNLFVFGYYEDDGYAVVIRNERHVGGSRLAGYHHLAVVIQKESSSSSKVTVYRNGDILWIAFIQSVLGNTNGLPWVIGQDWDSGPTTSDYFYGQFDEVRVWNYARGQLEIQATMNQKLTGNETGLIAYWPFDEGQGQLVLDHSNNGNDGLLGSSAGVDPNDPAWYETEWPHVDPIPAVSSEFEINAEDWSLDGDGEGPFHNATGGNPGGYIFGIDQGQSVSWYFLAPNKFLGNISDAYGQSLIFDLRQSSLDNQNNNSDDISLTNDTLTLHFNLVHNPQTFWTRYSIPLKEGRLWINASTGNPATQSEMQMVLSNLTELRIRGEYRTGPDTGDLDNVMLHGVTTSIDEQSNSIPEKFQLFQNYPNPFNPTTKIFYSLSKSGNITLKVYDMLGREVQTLVKEFKSSGSYAIDFNAGKLSSGIYFYRLQSDNFMATKKMLLLR